MKSFSEYNESVGESFELPGKPRKSKWSRRKLSDSPLTQKPSKWIKIGNPKKDKPDFGYPWSKEFPIPVN